MQFSNADWTKTTRFRPIERPIRVRFGKISVGIDMSTHAIDALLAALDECAGLLRDTEAAARFGLGQEAWIQALEVILARCNETRHHVLDIVDSF